MINASTFTFDSDTHTYRLNGQIVPSVTQVIGTIQLWRGMSPDALERARIRGHAVDDAINKFDAGELGLDDIDEEILPYVHAWVAFLSNTKSIVLDSQLAGYNATYRYAGTLDKIVQFHGGSIALIDIKATAVIEPETALQTAAYEAMGNVSQRNMNRFTLQLRPDATYRLYEWRDRNDFPTFLAALTLTNWRLKND